MAMHQLQHGVASALQRDMEMRHEGPATCAILYEFVGGKVRFETADTVSLYSLHLVEFSDEVDKLLACGFPEVSDVHTCEYYLSSTLLDGLPCLCHERLYCRVAAESSRERYGAVSAEVVASVLHLQEEACSVASRTA